jgi:hypothetical protein
MYKNIAVKVAKYYFMAGILVFISSFTLTLLGYILGINMGLSPH